MILRIDKREYDSDRVPVLFYWKTQKTKQHFVEEIISINNFSKFIKIYGFSYIKVEQGVYKATTSAKIKFSSREEKSSFLRHLHELGDDCNMYIACPDDVPYGVITEWINKSLSDMGIKPDMPIEITD